MLILFNRGMTQNLKPGRAISFSLPTKGSRRFTCIFSLAGTGKTKTLAHRVAHLILNGADPQRILLLTFTRRAAAEMTRRAALILGEVRRRESQKPVEAVAAVGISWSGTFHGIANRLLRLHAYSIGLNPSFTVLAELEPMYGRAAIRDQTHHANPFHFEVTMSDSSADVLRPPLRRERTLAAERANWQNPTPGLLGDYPKEGGRTDPGGHAETLQTGD